MSKANRIKIVISIYCIVILVNQNFATCIAQIKNDSIKNRIVSDTTAKVIIDTSLNTIVEYNAVIYRKDKVSDSIELLNAKINSYLLDTSLKANCLDKILIEGSFENRYLLINNMIAYYIKVLKPQKELSSLKLQLDKLKHKELLLKKEVDSKEKTFNSIMSSIHIKVDTLFGPEKRNYSGKRYLLYYVNNKKGVIKIVGNNTNGPATIQNTLNNSKETPLMITNAGMYQPNYQPQGLLISNGIKEMEIDSTKKYKSGNFYLYPNGIFFIDAENKFHISNTEFFVKNYLHSKNIKYATQSGPLLLDEDRSNKNISMGSSNYNIRNGVGIINENEAVFIISEDGVTFYDFNLVFRMVGCKSALYFDGFVSRMYINDKYPQRAPVFNDNNLGPMIIVYPKKK